MLTKLQRCSVIAGNADRVIHWYDNVIIETPDAQLECVNSWVPWMPSYIPSMPYAADAGLYPPESGNTRLKGHLDPGSLFDY